MRIAFTPEELKYLSDNVNKVLAVVRHRDITSGLARTVAKMRYKFSPNAAITFLTQKERAFLLDLLSYRQMDLVKRGSISSEVDNIQQLIDKLG